MKRIGIAASKIAKGNLFLYNIFVVFLTLLFALLIFFIAGSSIVVALIVIAYIISKGAYPDLERGWMPIMVICLKCLAALIGILVLYAVAINVKLRKR